MVTILGLGFTAQRLAHRLLDANVPTSAAFRGDPARFRDLAARGLRLIEWRDAAELPENSRLLHSIPSIPADETEALHALIRQLQPARVVYISSTSVYGAAETVDETTPAAPTEVKGQHRLAEEAWIAAGPWSALMLRSAAIYGPGRGVHTAIREGRAPRSAGVVSRIHVDDLAALAFAALFSDLEGAWPVADDVPCPSAEIIGQPMETFPITGRRVDGRKIRELLGVELKYPSWKTGIYAT